MGGTIHEANLKPAPIWSRRPTAFAAGASGCDAEDGPAPGTSLFTDLYRGPIVTLTLLRHAKSAHNRRPAVKMPSSCETSRAGLQGGAD